MEYFDKKTLKILKYIYKCGDKGAEWSYILDNFENASIEMLLEFNTSLYATAFYKDGKPIPYATFHITSVEGIRSYCTPKGSQLLEDRIFNLWKWAIPTIISLISLLVSIITFWLTLNGNEILKVMIIN